MAQDILVQYDYTDIDGPGEIASTTAGAIISLLKSVLVNGYGTKPGAGWSVAFEDAPNYICVFQNADGVYFRIDNSAAAGYARVVMYEAMTDANTGVGQCPTDVQLATGAFLLSVNKWLIFANEIGLYFVQPRSTTLSTFDLSATPPITYNANVWFFGSMIRYNAAADAYPGVISCAANTTSLNTYGVNFAYDRNDSLADAAASSSWFVQRDFAALIQSDNGSALRSIPGFNTSNNLGYAPTQPYPDPIRGDVLVLGKLLIMDRHLDAIRGELPGVWDLGSLYAPDDMTEFVVDGKTFIKLTAYVGGWSSKYIFRIG